MGNSLGAVVGLSYGTRVCTVVCDLNGEFDGDGLALFVDKLVGE